jgi:hypothetical protein
LLQEVFGKRIDANDAVITLQSHGEDGGYTDIEIRSGQHVHAILEAKLSWKLPTIDQLNRYLNRLITAGAKHQRLISVSAADQAHAGRQLPSSLQSPSSNANCPHGTFYAVLPMTRLSRAASTTDAVTVTNIYRVNKYFYLIGDIYQC